MVERLLLDGVDAKTRGLAVARQRHAAVSYFTYETETALPLRHAAVARTQIALHAPAFERMPELAAHNVWRHELP